jgi:hypothetical protein
MSDVEDTPGERRRRDPDSSEAPDGDLAAAKERDAERFVVDARPMGLRAGYEYDRIKEIAAELELEEIVRKLGR